MTKALLVAAVAAAAIGASATDLIYTQCADGGCTQGCQSTLVKANQCVKTNSSSITATYDATTVGIYKIDLYNTADCSGAPVKIAGLCNGCDNGMSAMCGGLPGALMIRYNCPQLGNDECGNCPDTTKLIFGQCAEIPNYTPKFPGYKYALVNWGCIAAGTVAKTVSYTSGSCSGSGFAQSAAIDTCSEGTMWAVANSTASLH